MSDAWAFSAVAMTISSFGSRTIPVRLGRAVTRGKDCCKALTSTVESRTAFCMLSAICLYLPCNPLFLFFGTLLAWGLLRVHPVHDLQEPLPRFGAINRHLRGKHNIRALHRRFQHVA